MKRRIFFKFKLVVRLRINKYSLQKLRVTMHFFKESVTAAFCSTKECKLYSVQTLLFGCNLQMELKNNWENVKKCHPAAETDLGHSWTKSNKPPKWKLKLQGHS